MSSNLYSSQTNTNYQQDIDFARAVMLANSKQKQEAYLIFKQLGNSTLGNWNPNVWLWIASLTKNFSEGQAALQKARQLGPLHPDLARAQQDFVIRRRRTLFLRYSSLVGIILCSFVMIFANFFVRQLWPFVATGNSGLYLRASFSDGSICGFFWLALFGLIGSLGVWLKQQTFASTLKPAIVVLVAAVFIVSLSWLLLRSDASWEKAYHNRVQVGNSSYILESRLPNRYVLRANFAAPNFLIYKCDQSGVFCQLFDNIDNSQWVDNQSSDYVYMLLRQQDYRIRYNATSNSLEIERTWNRQGVIIINTISLN